MDILRPELLVQALRKGAQRKLARRKRRRRLIPAPGRRCASEDQRPALALPVEGRVLECEDRSAREREGRDHVRVRGFAHLLLRDVEEPLAHVERRVPHRDTHLLVRPVLLDRGERALDVGVVVFGDGERRGLARGSGSVVHMYICYKK